MSTEEIHKVKHIIPPISKADYYYLCVSVTSGTFKLTVKERKLLSMLCLYYNKYSEISGHTEEDIFEEVFSNRTRTAIRKLLDMTESNFNNYVAKLKRRKILYIKDKKLRVKGAFIFPEPITTEITFRIELK